MRKIILPIIFIILFGYLAWLADNSQGRLNLIINSKPAYLFSLLPKERLSLIEIPETSLIELTHGFGKYRLGSIYDLGLLENRGGELLTDSIQESFGVPIDGFILTNKDPQSSIIKVITEAIQNKASTNLDRLTLLRLWWQVRQLRSDQIIKFSLTLEENDPGKTDQLLADLFKEPIIRQEDLAIAVLNGTDHSGLAQRVVRLVSNIGGRVIKVGDLDQKISDCQIWVSSAARKSQTYSRLNQTYHCRLVTGPVSELRADLVIVLGEKYWQKLTEKW